MALNARDAMPDGGKLTIETTNSFLDEAYIAGITEPVERGQYVLIAVTDTGTGMDKATLARVFDPFFTTKETGKGTGLGLSQVYGFVRQTSGHVRIYSEVGEGTTVKVHTGSDAPTERKKETNAPLRAIGAETVLAWISTDWNPSNAGFGKGFRRLGISALSVIRYGELTTRVHAVSFTPATILGESSAPRFRCMNLRRMPVLSCRRRTADLLISSSARMVPATIRT